MTVLKHLIVLAGMVIHISAYSTTAGTTIHVECNQSNPLGECYGCDLQVFMNDDCTQGYVCSSASPDAGCLYECPDGYKLVPDFGSDGTDITWSCVEEEGHICPGAFKIFCPNEDDAVPPEGISVFDTDRCECDGELFVSPDCKHADRCSAVGLDSYVIRNAADCTGDETLLINYMTWETSCALDVDNCPGQGGFALGSEHCSTVPVDPLCTYTEKPFTEQIQCSCDNQVFVNSDCTMAFECQSDIPDIAPPYAEGCLVECDEGQAIYPTFFNGGNVEFTCFDSDLVSCPGEYNINCASDPIDPSEEDCDCNGQTFVAPDCGSAAYCHLDGNSGYEKYELVCYEGEIVAFDFRTMNWGCRLDDGSCPGAGGFQVGCGATDPDTTTDSIDTTTSNGSTSSRSTSSTADITTTTTSIETTTSTTEEDLDTTTMSVTTTNDISDGTTAIITTTTTTEPDGTTSTSTLTNIDNVDGSTTVIQTLTITNPDGTTSTTTETTKTNPDGTGSTTTTVTETGPDGTTTTTTSSSTVNLDGTVETKKLATCFPE